MRDLHLFVVEHERKLEKKLAAAIAVRRQTTTQSPKTAKTAWPMQYEVTPH